MENFSYTPSYPDSATSTPRSLETAFENPPPWEDHHQQQNYKVKFMCSYGGKILPKPHDHQLSYVGGDTKIISVDRNIKFDSLVPKLASLCDEYEGVLIKYQLPDEDLDALISVTNDDDLDNMMHEYDRLCRASSKPARLRLFLFPAAGGGGSGAVTSAPASQPAQSNKDDLLLFGLEKEVVVPPPVQQPREAEVKIPAAVSDQILKHIEDLQRLKLEEQQGLLYRTKSDDSLGRGTFSRPNVPGTGPAPVGSRPEKALPGGGRVYQTTSLGREQPFYTMSQPVPGMRPATEPEILYRRTEGTDTNFNQGYYAAVQMMPSPPPPVQSVAVAPPVLQPQAPPKVGPLRYPEGIGMVRTSSPVQYPQMVYDNMVGRQVYYNGPQGSQVVAGPPRTQAATAPQYQPVAAEMRPAAGLLNHGGGAAVVPKATHQGDSV